MPGPVLTNAQSVALFLDFDGTLVDIVDHPDDVRIEDETRTILSRLQDLLDGAIAIVTGREIETVDRFLDPLRLPVAGIHGMMRRDHAGEIRVADHDAYALEQIAGSLEAFAGGHNGLLIENKLINVALHYRGRPELEGDCIVAVEKAVAPYDAIEIKRGHCVLEAKPDVADKGMAVEDFMTEEPFAGRRPVFAGDDVTDEDAFLAVNRLGGDSIKIGEGETAASHRMKATADLLDWLRNTANCLEKGHVS